MRGYKKQQGGYGEDLAVTFLQNLGYKIIGRNYLIRGGEIDIVALDGPTTVIVEVKLRTGKDYGLAIESITPSKLRSIIKTARFYSFEKVVKGPLRIDLIAIDIKMGKPEIEHTKNITEGLILPF
jgi:putative endonuclease